jgi:hypothetical protein
VSATRNVSKITLIGLSLLFVLGVLSGPVGSQPTDRLADDAISSRSEVAEAALTALRAEGPAGLDRLLRAHAGVLERGAADPDWWRVRVAVDRVAGQRDAIVSRLYWYTDLEAAKAAARASGRPILSLRLLGRLDEELSCANSRLFRSVLYANASVSAELRDRWVLHWESERAAPRITVDYGDGRVLERTITGNSIHYVLNSEGRPIDALPGLWGPGGFLRELRSAEAVARSTAKLPAAERFDALRAFHADRVKLAAEAWSKQMTATLASAGDASLQESLDLLSNDPAALAGSLALRKSVVEAPLLREIRRTPGGVQRLDLYSWARVASRFAGEARLDAASRSLIRSKLRDEPGSDSGEERLERVIERLELGIALDQVQNEFALRPALDRWLAGDAAADDLKALNARVYAELFLTPASDPWLGLAPPDEYAALDGEGLRTRAR